MRIVEPQGKVIQATAPKPLERLQLGDQKLERLQDATSRATAGLSDHPLLTGKLLPDVSLDGPADTDGAVLTHGLGRVPLGWILVDKDVASDVWCSQKTAKQLVLHSAAACRVSLWVF
jgi:hypothetical protein